MPSRSGTKPAAKASRPPKRTKPEKGSQATAEQFEREDMGIAPKE